MKSKNNKGIISKNEKYNREDEKNIKMTIIINANPIPQSHEI